MAVQVLNSVDGSIPSIAGKTFYAGPAMALEWERVNVPEAGEIKDAEGELTTAETAAKKTGAYPTKLVKAKSHLAQLLKEQNEKPKINDELDALDLDDNSTGTKIAAVRDVSSDGNCGYYAIMYGYLERAALLVGTGDDEEKDEGEAILENIANQYKKNYRDFSKSITGIDRNELCTPAEFKAFINTIKDAKTQNERLALLNKAFNYQSKTGTPNFAKSCVAYLRHQMVDEVEKIRKREEQKPGNSSDPVKNQQAKQETNAQLDKAITQIKTMPEFLNANLLPLAANALNTRIYLASLTDTGMNKTCGGTRGDKRPPEIALLHKGIHFRQARLQSVHSLITEDHINSTYTGLEQNPLASDSDDEDSKAVDTSVSYNTDDITPTAKDFTAVAEATLTRQDEIITINTGMEQKDFKAIAKTVPGFEADKVKVTTQGESWVATDPTTKNTLTRERINEHSGSYRVELYQENATVKQCIEKIAQAYKKEYEARKQPLTTPVVLTINSGEADTKTWRNVFVDAGFTNLTINGETVAVSRFPDSLFSSEKVGSRPGDEKEQEGESSSYHKKHASL